MKVFCVRHWTKNNERFTHSTKGDANEIATNIGPAGHDHVDRAGELELCRRCTTGGQGLLGERDGAVELCSSQTDRHFLALRWRAPASACVGKDQR